MKNARAIEGRVIPRVCTICTNAHLENFSLPRMKFDFSLTKRRLCKFFATYKKPLISINSRKQKWWLIRKTTKNRRLLQYSNNKDDDDVLGKILRKSQFRKWSQNLHKGWKYLGFPRAEIRTWSLLVLRSVFCLPLGHHLEVVQGEVAGLRRREKNESFASSAPYSSVTVTSYHPPDFEPAMW